MASTLTFTSAPFNRVTQFTISDGVVAKDILPIDATYDRRVYSISVYTDETVARDVDVHLSDGTTIWQLTTISVPINSGNTNAIVPVDILTHTQMAPYVKQRDASGAPYLNLPKGWSIRLAYGATMTTAKVANFVINGETYA
jgi:hypothetical protein